MKKLILVPIIAILVLSCEDNDFLDQVPKDQITDANFWTQASDLEVFLNGRYVIFPGFPTHGGGPYHADANSDAMIGNLFNLRLAGEVTAAGSDERWDDQWEQIRAVNFFLENSQRVIDANGGTNPLINHYIGEGYFFRAYLYFNLLRDFGGVPWIAEAPELDEEDILFAPRQPRNVIADNILSDLDTAIGLLRDVIEDFRVNRSVALALKSRVALFEGTWEKYHQGTVFGGSGNPDDYFNQAVNAAETLINQGNYSIAPSYQALFNRSDLGGNPEIIFWKQYALGINAHNSQRFVGIIPSGLGVTKSLVESFLCTDGLPISVSPLYQGDANLTVEFTNRDPRLDHVLFKPGDPINENVNYSVAPINLGGENLNPTGYELQKSSFPSAQLQQEDFGSTTAAIQFRFAEVLLNFAEAKAELGDITQADLDVSINQLRRRPDVNMPDLDMGNIANDPNWEFPTVSPIINEIRRERKVELACEGYRFNDLLRWRGHELFLDQRPLGARFVPEDYVDADPPADPFLSNGLIDHYQESLPNGYGFIPDRDYLVAIPLVQVELAGYEQNPGW